jgi:hypothetical protein
LNAEFSYKVVEQAKEFDWEMVRGHFCSECVEKKGLKRYDKYALRKKRCRVYREFIAGKYSSVADAARQSGLRGEVHMHFRRMKRIYDSHGEEGLRRWENGKEPGGE